MAISQATVHDFNDLARRCQNMCKKFKWERDWKEGGCYLHLEVSELIESIRGKKGLPVLEAGDVLFVFLSVLREHNIDLKDVLTSFDEYLTKLERN